MTFVRFAVMTAAYAVAAFAVAWLAASLALAGLPAGVSLGVKAVLVTAAVVVVTLLGTRELPRLAARDTVLVALASLLGFVLDPFTWAGRTLVGHALADPGAVTVAVDLLVWTAATGVAATAVARRVREHATVGYA